MPKGGEAAAFGAEMSEGGGVDVDLPTAGAGDEAQIGGGQCRQGMAQGRVPQARGTDSGNSPARPASLARQTPRSVIRPVT
jgi:hypothetical protein